jgi:segregation and condensation protein B
MYNRHGTFPKDNYSMSVFLPDNKSELTGRVEALLFTALGPISAGHISEALGVRVNAIEEAILELNLLYTAGRGLRIQKEKGKYQITTTPEFAEDIERFLGLEAVARLSRAAIETLAIIAYKQPITRPAVDAIRGVNSDGVIKSILTKNLIEEVGRAEGPGRPILYGTTTDFLQHFGLNSLEDLPPLKIDENAEIRDTELLKD